jgi:hypothetical protein
MLVQSQPGTVVASGSLIGPAGDQGPQGVQGVQGAVGPQGNQGIQGITGQAAFTTTSSAFTVPAVGSTTVVTFVNVAWVTIGELVYVDQAGGGGAGSPGVLQVTAINGNNVTLLNPTAPPTIPTASTTTPGLVNTLSGNSTDYIGGDNACHSLAVVQGTRAVNVIGNPNFEVDARTVGAGPGASGTFGIDRWSWNYIASGGAGVGWKVTDASPTGVIIPGTSVCISSKFLRLTVTAQETAPPAGDYIFIQEQIEGCFLRELIGGVHSLSILARCSAPISFGLALRDTGSAHSLTKLASISTANVWTIISLPNMPIWTPGATWSLQPGVGGYYLAITLMCGSTYMAPANDTWQNGNFIGAAGQGNFCALPVNTTLDIGFIQHEPGSQCTPFLDKNFPQNYQECLRYYAKSYAYNLREGSTSGLSGCAYIAMGSTWNWNMGNMLWPVEMAKTPTVRYFNPSTGAANGAYGWPSGASYTVSSQTPWGITSRGNHGISVTVTPAANDYVAVSWAADTGM